MENLKKARKEKNMTQVEVAKLVGVTANTYRNWEYGANAPSDENLEKLKEILEV
jgi:transcriptional regulator with XRE-family HTH domain